MYYKKEKFLILTVGNNTDSLIKTINDEKFNQDLIYFIHSSESKDKVQEIIEKTGIVQEKDYKCLEVEDANDFEKCFRDSRNLIKELNEGNNEIGIDFTGGTKPMSLGLVLSVLDNEKLTYIIYTAGNRDNEGIGNVISGFEEITEQLNPYNTLAINEFKRGKEFFDNYQYRSALENFELAKDKTNDSKLKELAEYYIKLVKFYQRWDKFDKNIKLYDKKEKLPIALKELIEDCPKSFNNDIENHNKFINKMNENYKFLINKFDSDKSKGIKYFLPDLLNNAYRKIEEGNYDDAVARLYRCIELIAQLELNNMGIIDIKGLDSYEFYINKEKFDKKVKNKPRIKEEINKWYEFKNNKDKIEISRNKSYKLLKLFKNPIGEKYFNNRKLKNKIQLRNTSILAHGLNALNRKDTEQLYKIVLEFSEESFEHINRKNPDLKIYMELSKFPKFNQ